MRQQRVCHYCGQNLPEIRLGVKLSPLKARLFDLIRRSGDDGIIGPDLLDILRYGEPSLRTTAQEKQHPNGIRSLDTIKAHVAQINDLIRDEGYEIRGRGAYRLVKYEAA